MKNILIITPIYIPGVNGGGPIVSIKNLVDLLGDKYKFYIYTKDRDFGKKNSYNNIKNNSWNSVGRSEVFYSDKNKLSYIRRVIKESKCEDIYINSFFSPFSIKFYMGVLILGEIKKKRIIVAVRGEFSDAALRMKRIKKKLYIMIYKILLFRSSIVFQATCHEEKMEIERIFKKANIIEASNLSEAMNFEIDKLEVKSINKLKMVYMSRITSKKNLLYALDCLKNIKDGEINFDIYGPVEDMLYWNKCLSVIRGLPENIKVSYKGTIDHKDISGMFKKYHAFFFPTKGENFGHAINESIRNGCIPIISDRTPWINLKQFNAGWDLSLENKNLFIEKIYLLLKMNQEEINKMRNGIVKYLDENKNDFKDIERYEKVF